MSTARWGALVVSTLEGQTFYRDAYRMLGFSKQTTFEKLALGSGQTELHQEKAPICSHH